MVKMIVFFIKIDIELLLLQYKVELWRGVSLRKVRSSVPTQHNDELCLVHFCMYM